MKQILMLIALFLATSFSFSQTKEKIKGSRVITQNVIEIENFNAIEVEDNFEIILSKSDKPSLEIAADDNLHDVISHTVVGNSLKISSLKNVSSAKKFSIRINYTDKLNAITTKTNVKLTGLNTIELDTLSLKSYGKSELLLNLTVPHLNISLNDKTEAELNIRSQNLALELSQYANLEALVNNTEASKVDLYQNGKAKIEGETKNLKIRIDNNASLTAKKFQARTVIINSENYAKTAIMATESIVISASGKSQIELYGEPKIELPVFTNSSTLYKKEL